VPTLDKHYNVKPLPNEHHFEQRLARAARAIRAEAEGRTCGGCAHARWLNGQNGHQQSGYCATQICVFTDGEVVLVSTEAVACSSYQRRRRPPMTP